MWHKCRELFPHVWMLRSFERSVWWKKFFPWLAMTKNSSCHMLAPHWKSTTVACQELVSLFMPCGPPPLLRNGPSVRRLPREHCRNHCGKRFPNWLRKKNDNLELRWGVHCPLFCKAVIRSEKRNHSFKNVTTPSRTNKKSKQKILVDRWYSMKQYKKKRTTKCRTSVA